MAGVRLVGTRIDLPLRHWSVLVWSVGAIALGADRWAMMRLVLRDVAVMIVAGVSIGAGAALMVTDLTRHVLFGLTPTDPRVFLVAASVLAGASVLAAWLPARRAARVDPLVALRHE